MTKDQKFALKQALLNLHKLVEVAIGYVRPDSRGANKQQEVEKVFMQFQEIIKYIEECDNG